MRESQEVSFVDDDLSIEHLRRVEASGEISELSISDLVEADSPRCGGESDTHVRVLSEVSSDLPPILVRRATMKIIDGMHRLRAARLKGAATIRARLLDCTEQEAFMISVQSNVEHGLPLRLSDRREAARRVLTVHPQWSDRFVGAMTGLSHKTVGAVRRRSSGEIPQWDHRVGRDGRVQRVRGQGRPEDGRGASTTTRDERVEPRPVPARPLDPSPICEPPDDEPLELQRQRLNLEALLRDPSLRLSESGRCLLRLLSTRGVTHRDWSNVLRDLPPHCTPMIVELARHNAAVWQQFGDDLHSYTTTVND